MLIKRKRKGKRKRKRKTFFKKFLSAFFLFSIVFFSSLLIFRWLEFENKLIVKIPNSLCSLAPRNQEECKNFEKFCSKFERNKVAYTICMASHFLNYGLEYSKKVCMTLKTDYERKHCFAKVLSEVDVEKAVEQCGEITDEFDKIHCLTDVMRNFDLESALKKCESLKDEDRVNYCKAITLAISDKEKAKQYCEKLQSVTLIKLCKGEVERE